MRFFVWQWNFAYGFPCANHTSGPLGIAWPQLQEEPGWPPKHTSWLKINPASLAAKTMWDGANVSGQVASHGNIRPFFQGIMEIPSSLFLSERACTVCSRREGIFAEASGDQPSKKGKDPKYTLLKFSQVCLGQRPLPSSRNWDSRTGLRLVSHTPCSSCYRAL